MNRKAQALLFVSLFFTGGFVFGLWAHTTNAQFAVGRPYGGVVRMVWECTCSAGLWVVSGGPVPSSTLVRPKPAAAGGAPGIYSFFVHRPGSWQLGLSIPCDICRTARLCKPLPTTGEVGLCGIVGTSY